MAELTIKQISQKIYFIRGHRVMLDSDLADLYGVETKNLNKAVLRNSDRFPEDFCFKLTDEEYKTLRFQFVTSKITEEKRGGRQYLPNAFTEQGVAMLSGVLKSQKAIQVNIEIMRTFVRIREFMLTNQELARKLRDLEARYDAQFKIVFDAIRELMNPPIPPKGKIGI